MRRPNLVLSAVVLGLAVLVGCAKKSKSDAVASSTPEPAAAPAPAKGPPAGGAPAGKAQPGGPSLFTVTADSTAAAPMGGMPTYGMPTGAVGGYVPPMGGMPMGGAPMAAAPRAVELTQCRFTKVEEALTAAKGKVVFVDCWARWCPPCLASFPELVKKHEKYGAKGLVCISVSLDAGRRAFNPDQVLSFLKEKNAAFQNFYLTDLGADNAAMEQRFTEISGIPHAVLFNKQGERVWVGHPMRPEVVRKIEEELAK
jgi:thiol-disulfide isomerase/thioredoxin